MPELHEDLQGDVRDYLDRQVRSGFADLETLAESAGEYFANEADRAVVEAFARASLQDVLLALRNEQQHWPSTTDCDRLDAAFTELEANGIVARQNFWCCGTCGLAAIGGEIEQAQAEGVRVRGYTFYHEQDTEAAVEGQGIFLCYGALEHEEPQALEIAREVQQTLESHGLATEWNGTLGQRIGVTLDWKRRLDLST